MNNWLCQVGTFSVIVIIVMDQPVRELARKSGEFLLKRFDAFE